ncbi:Fic family protein [Halomonas sp. DQ26W]|uniref:Fic family protein n=1 Tax=Halomonas sp. DQ26W TaxID=2282311 RepID=UPI000DF7247B|nr:Fic family protein [Halomonas sp. DQ26W]RDB44123.1 Fic family protein [Halomonas sp. DQ26W]
MKIPLTPPDHMEIMLKLIEGKNHQRYIYILQKNIGPLHKDDEYIHWDKLRHITPPSDLSHEEYWLALKSARSSQYRHTHLKDKHDQPFKYIITDKLLKELLWIEKNSSGSILMENEDANSRIGKSYIYNSLIEEAISSSQLEGASTTRRVAKEMIQKNRKPKDKHEKMIFNNYYAMNFIKEIENEDLTPPIIFELHRMLTDGTFDPQDEGNEGKLRKASDDICVFAPDDTLLHIPPSAKTLENRLQEICNFANSENDSNCPPVIKAIILHFMIGYDHPFVDGNGRTARALFYWYLAKNKYWLIEYISISRILKRSLARYIKSYLYTETDDADLTYFIDHQMKVIQMSIQELHDYLREKNKQIQDTKELLRSTNLVDKLNYRQIQLIERALKNPGEEYTINQHKKEYEISYQTARTDLLKLSDKLELLRKRKDRKKDVFSVPNDLAFRIQSHGK